MSTLKGTALFKEIQSNPNLREALMDAAKVLQEEGMRRPYRGITERQCVTDLMRIFRLRR